MNVWGRLLIYTLIAVSIYALLDYHFDNKQECADAFSKNFCYNKELEFWSGNYASGEVYCLNDNNKMEEFYSREMEELC